MATPTPTTPTPESCMYVVDPVTRCETQRPCDSCLQKPGCMVGVIGACQPSAVRPDDPWHYSRAQLRNFTLPGLKDSSNASAIKEKQDWEFSSADTKYCPTDDAVCKQCIQERFWLPAGVEHDNRYCIGEHGCVCIYNCEFNKNALETMCPRSPLPTLYTEDDGNVATAAPPWTMPVVTTTPTPSTSPVPTSAPAVIVITTTKSDVMNTVLIVAACFFGVSCFVGFVYWCCWRQRPSVPMAIPVKIDTPRDDNEATVERDVWRGHGEYTASR